MLDQFDKQKHRGRLGFGLYDRDYGHIVKSPKERKALSWLARYPSSEIMFHHRYPTSTENTKSAAHPFSTRKFFKGVNYILVHNGQVSNAWELKKAHDELGIVYSSLQADGRYNDSEALLWDVSLYLQGKQDEMKAKGTIAFICMALYTDKTKDTLYFARNTNPLNMFFNKKKGLFLSSEGKGAPILAHKLYSFKYLNKHMEYKELLIPTNYVPTPPAKEPYKYSLPNHADYSDDEYWERWAAQAATKEAHEAELRDRLMEDDPTEVEDTPPRLKETALTFTINDRQRQVDIMRRFKDYINWAKGNITDAYQMLQADLTWLEDSITIYWAQNEEINDDAEYELEVHKAVIECMLHDPEWLRVDSVHSMYRGQQTLGEDFEPDSVQAIIKGKLDKARKQVNKAIEAKVKEATC